MRALCVATVLVLVITSAAMANDVSSALRSELAPTGTLRVGLNHGSFLLVTAGATAEDPRGVAPDVARELGRRLGVPVSFVKFDTAGKPAAAVEARAGD